MKLTFKQLWNFLAIYGVFFAIFSGIEEITNGKLWKVIISILLTIIIYKKLINKQENI